MPKLLALIRKKPDISDKQFKAYYEMNHAPLITSIFPMLHEYKRTYLVASNMLNGNYTLESEKLDIAYSVITELGFKTHKALDEFMVIASKDEIVEMIRKDYSNFLLSEKTVMNQLDQ